MKKFIFCISLALTGLMTACVDKNEAVDADSKPDWLGGSIYQELKNPSHLTGTFTQYLRLIDDLGYAETLNRTGSKTVFPANDEAFARFFQSNAWGVTSYEQLTVAQKKLLLYSSMLDNALLIGMLSNASNTSGAESTVSRGVAMKHQTNLNLIDTIQHFTSGDQMPQNNKYWNKFRSGVADMYVVSDATRPMMVHFTREHMLSNGIKTTGDVNFDNDFAILTGSEYNDTVASAYIFNDAIIRKDITCLNGYIHQMKDVIVPPGNMAQVLRYGDDTKYFSRVLDYFSAPFSNMTVTNSYNSWAAEQRKAGYNVNDIDTIYEVRYLNSKTSHAQTTDPDGNIISSSYLLNFDPGWNQYSPSGVSGGVDYTIADVASMFVPTDQAMVKFFTEGGDGAYLIDLYGVHKGAANNAANLAENLDALYTKQPQILTSFVNNLMKSSFINTVPSKFETIPNDANEYMGVTLDKVNQRDGRYNITVANNGVIYKMNELIAPDEYQSVMAPSSVYPDMQIMNWAVKEPDASQKLGVDFRYYLMSMGSRFAFFIPDSLAFERYYIDPTSLGKNKPRAFKFVYGNNGTRTTVSCVAYDYNPTTGVIGDVQSSTVPFEEWRSQLVDILNYHTVVLGEDDVLGENHYYKTKHGGEIYIDKVEENGTVKSGQQIDNGVEPSKIVTVYNEKNGTAFRIDHVIQAPRNSVSKTLQNNSAKFSEFYDFLSNFSGSDDLLIWAGISNVAAQTGMPTELDGYVIFTANRGSGTNTVYGCCIDENVKMFNTYNYTLYAPNNAAMQLAYAAGLPKWSQVQALHDQYTQVEQAGGTPDESLKTKARTMIDKMKNFARYHFQNTSVYADNKVASARYNTLITNEVGLAYELVVSGGGNTLNVRDEMGNTHVINANDSSKKTNLMTRDYWFDKTRGEATQIYTSSFCVIHELSEPLDSGQWQYSE